MVLPKRGGVVGEGFDDVWSDTSFLEGIIVIVFILFFGLVIGGA